MNTMKSLGLAILFIALSQSLIAQTALISYGSNFAYYDNQQEPPAQGSDEWEDLNYDDASWSTGNAELGYGDGDESTVINNNTYTGYFRHEFNVTNPGQYSDIDLDLTYDDGAVVYLNGVEVWRVNMPGGTISYNTFSSTTSNDNAQASTNLVNNLISGINVLAVEVHQRSTSSSDISFNFKLTGNVPGAVSVDRGPYLQKGTPTTMTVRWRTGSSTESIIDYGTSPTNLNMQVSDLAGKTEHVMEISGLNADTKYYYEVSNSSAVLVPASTDLYFQTSPTAGTVQSVRAWILGDCGTANSNQRAVRDAYYNYVGANHTDMILFLGDNAYNSGTDSEYQYGVFENMYEAKLQNTVAYSCLGNHDGYSADSGNQTGPYYDIFTFPTAAEGGGVASGTEAYYSYDYANIHFIVLDAYDTNRNVGGTMYNWCLNDIQNTTQEWIVAYWHHPPYTKGSHDSDSESNLIDMRENFLPILEDNGVDLVLGGHSHSYERTYFIKGHYGNSNSFDINTHTVGTTGDGDGQASGNGTYYKEITGPDAGDGAVYITTGSAGKTSGGSLDHEAMYTSLNLLGSCVLEVDGNQMDVKFIRSNGTIEDFFTIDKEASCTPGNSCDDGNVCTINDIYDAQCNCAGTFQDSDGDTVCDADDVCPGFNDLADADGDSVPDGCDICPGFDDNVDSDGDGVANGCDVCPGFDDTIDSDGDGVADGCDTCPGFDDTIDADGDGVADGCDACPGFDDALDGDGDTVPDGCDQCPTQDDALIGTACDDLDPCTANDIYDSNCNCAGTPTSDSDGDGVCDAADLCPGFDDAIDADGDGVPDGCDVCAGFDDTVDTDGDNVPDGCDACPLDANDDSDGDGVCDSNDICAGFDDTIDSDGDTVPDGCDSCPLDANDDSDGDGVCDSNDICPGFDDTVDSDGDTVPDGCDVCPLDANDDSDGDGVCDSQDQCPGQDDALIGQPCDDGIACTINDVYDNNCGCSGVFEDLDGDGYCSVNDPNDSDPCIPDAGAPNCEPCTEIYFDTFDSSWGPIWNDGGGDCERKKDNNRAYSPEHSIKIKDDSGIESSTYTNSLDMSAYDFAEMEFTFISKNGVPDEYFLLEVSTDGGSSFTTIETWEHNVDFLENTRSWELVTINSISFTTNTVFRLRCDAWDNDLEIYMDNIRINACELSCAPGLPCDDGDPCTINDVTDVDCGCAGIFEDSDNDTVCDYFDQCPGQDDALIGTACDDGIVCTINDVYDSNCGCVGIYQDSDGDGTCDGEDQCPGQDDSLIGQSCDDGDNCTINDVYNANCGCEGTPEQDSDGDGVCDLNDQCPGQDDGIIGTPCEDGDPCTTGEVYDSACNCGTGTYTDDDGDGYCIGNDSNDNDPCIPDPAAPNCNPCAELYFDNFDVDWGPIWNDGGKECERKKDSNKAYSPEYSIKIKKDKGILSSFYTDALDLSSYGYLDIEFTFITKRGKDYEKFLLEVSTDGGSNYTLIQDWENDVDFVENTRYWEFVTVSSISFSSNTVIRFRSNAIEDDLEIYIDDITITGCGSPLDGGGSENRATRHEDSNNLNGMDAQKLKVYPVPTKGELYVDINQLMDQAAKLSIFNMSGELVYFMDIDNTHTGIINLDVSNLSAGMYMIKVHNEHIQYKMSKIIISPF